MALNAVFLDFAGTLVDVHPGVGAVYARVARAWGIDVDPTEIERVFRRVYAQQPPLTFSGRSERARQQAEYHWWRRVVAACLEACGVRTDSVPFEAYFADLYATFARADVWRLYPDAIPLLRRLRAAGIRVYIVSNFDSRIASLVRALGLARWVEDVIYSAAVGWAKPDPRIFAAACARARVVPQSALHIGDDPVADYRGARAAGLHARWLARGSPPDARVPPEDTVFTLTEVRFDGVV